MDYLRPVFLCDGILKSAIKCENDETLASSAAENLYGYFNYNLGFISNSNNIKTRIKLIIFQSFIFHNKI